MIKDRLHTAGKMAEAHAKQFNKLMDDLDAKIIELGVDSFEAKRFRSFRKEIDVALRERDSAKLANLVSRI